MSRNELTLTEILIRQSSRVHCQKFNDQGCQNIKEKVKERKKKFLREMIIFEIKPK